MKTENANSTIIDGGRDVVDVLNINGIEYSKCDVERLLLESYKFRSLFLENFKITLKELDNILGVNKLYENELKKEYLAFLGSLGVQNLLNSRRTIHTPYTKK